MPSLEIYAIVGLAILIYMTIIWIASLVLRDSSIVDIFWGAGFVVANWIYFALADGFPGRQWLVNVLVTIWGLRLSLYILWRNWGKGEDYRYRQMRAKAGGRWWWQSYFQVFILQGLLMWIISVPLLAAQFSATPDHLTAVDWIAVGVWIVGFFFEAMGDYQMARFKANPANKGKVLDRGVWHYTRHPNYFGDATQWWAYYLLALAAGAWWTIFSPVIMTTFLLRVSGVTLLEKNLQETKPQYRTYIETTSSFIPWFPKKKSDENRA